MTADHRKKILVPVKAHGTPISWINEVFENLDDESADLITKHLIASVLRNLHPSLNVKDETNTSTYDRQDGPYLLSIGSLAYHISGNPSPAIIRECERTVSDKRQTLLFVRNSNVERAVAQAKKKKIEKRIMVFGVEDYISLSIISMSHDRKMDSLECLKAILEGYNRSVEGIDAVPALALALSDA